MKASIPGVHASFHQLHDTRHFDIFVTGSSQLKKPSGGPKGLIGPPCHNDGGQVIIYLPLMRRLPHHLLNPNKVSLNELSGMLREIGEGLRTVPVDEFLDIIQNNYEHPGLRKYIENY